jgi:hypothetical protein
MRKATNRSFVRKLGFLVCAASIIGVLFGAPSMARAFPAPGGRPWKCSKGGCGPGGTCCMPQLGLVPMCCGVRGNKAVCCLDGSCTGTNSCPPGAVGVDPATVK